MAEKAVDETPALGGMNVFNAVTSRIHPSLPLKFPDGRSVFAWVSPRENPGQTPGGQPLDRLGALSLSKWQAATVPGGRRTLP